MPILKKKLGQLIAALKGACKRKRVGTKDSLTLPLPLTPTFNPNLTPTPTPNQVGTEDSLSFELDMAAIRKKKGQKKKLTQVLAQA